MRERRESLAQYRLAPDQFCLFLRLKKSLIARLKHTHTHIFLHDEYNYNNNNKHNVL